MPRDKRLYMTFPIDFWQHPKIEELSDAAFRAFVEMNGFSRMQDLDGRIPEAAAARRWKVRPINELLNSHPDRPVLLREGTEYVLRDYAEHQMTRADREALVLRNRTNGARGGRPKSEPEKKPKRNPVGSEWVSGSVTQKNPELESELELEVKRLKTSSYVPDAQSGNDDGPRFPKPSKGGTDLNRVDTALKRFCQRTATETQLHTIVSEIVGRSTGTITSMTSFIVKAIENDWAEWQAFIDSGKDTP